MIFGGGLSLQKRQLSNLMIQKQAFLIYLLVIEEKGYKLKLKKGNPLPKDRALAISFCLIGILLAVYFSLLQLMARFHGPNH